MHFRRFVLLCGILAIASACLWVPYKAGEYSWVFSPPWNSGSIDLPRLVVTLMAVIALSAFAYLASSWVSMDGWVSRLFEWRMLQIGGLVVVVGLLVWHKQADPITPSGRRAQYEQWTEEEIREAVRRWFIHNRPISTSTSPASGQNTSASTRP